MEILPRHVRRLSPGAATWMVTLAFVTFAAVRGTYPSRPLAASAPPDQFSAERSFALLKRVLGDEQAHPVGSKAHDQVRDRIFHELEALGLHPVVQQTSMPRTEAFRPDAFTGPIALENILVTLPGSDPTGTVALVCHYDSVSDGPGVSDDGSGVAIALEIIRSLQQSSHKPRNHLLVLFTDGEELGLLGAKAFWKEPRELSAVVNLEARGTSGPSLMFETTSNSKSIVDGLRDMPHPVSGSLFPFVYRLLPNDTDFTVFRKHGVSGANFAFIRGVGNYHTRSDDLSHLDHASLQHQGESALAMTRHLLAVRQPEPKSEELVFFDLLGKTIVSWPETWSLALAVFSSLSILTLAFREVRSRVFTWAQLGAGLAAFFTSVASSVVVSSLCVIPILTLVSRDTALSIPSVVTLSIATLVALVSAFAPMRLFGKRTTPQARWTGSTIGWALLVLATSNFPAAGYLLLAPLCVMACGAVLRMTLPPRHLGISRGFLLGAAALATALLVPVAIHFCDAVVGLALVPCSVLFTLFVVWIPGKQVWRIEILGS